MVIHNGYSTVQGHYYAIVRSQDGEWVKYDDEFVEKRGNISEFKEDTKNAYILFYKKFYLDTL